jgi:hypothetical protein
MDIEAVHGKKKNKASLLLYNFKVYYITVTRIASRYSDLLRLDGPGFETLWGAMIFLPS